VLRWNITVNAEVLTSYLKNFNYWKGNYSAIAQHLGAIDWPDVLQGKSVSDMWNYFKTVVIRFMDDYMLHPTEV